MKKSRDVPLLIIGTITLLSACGKEEQVMQNLYANRHECQQDWGDDPRDCNYSGGGGYGGGGGYSGPRYIWDHKTGRPYAVDADGSTRALRNAAVMQGTPGQAVKGRAMLVRHSTVTRGGFGFSSRGFSSGG
jgi:uncharacterized protein YgiB involved in biofilm formation